MKLASFIFFVSVVQGASVGIQLPKSKDRSQNPAIIQEAVGIIVSFFGDAATIVADTPSVTEMTVTNAGHAYSLHLTVNTLYCQVTGPSAYLHQFTRMIQGLIGGEFYTVRHADSGPSVPKEVPKPIISKYASMCPKCKKEVRIGQLIARHADYENRWCHFDCGMSMSSPASGLSFNCPNESTSAPSSSAHVHHAATSDNAQFSDEELVATFARMALAVQSHMHQDQASSHEHAPESNNRASSSHENRESRSSRRRSKSCSVQ